MKKLVWSDEFATGDEIIDFQHKKIFGYLNMLYAANDTKAVPISLVKNTLQSLIEYTRVHFEDEEHAMLSMGYPNFNAHKNEHAKCAKQMINFKERFDKSEDIREELLHYITGWITVHITQEDLAAFKLKNK
jgi:hemerythrin